MLKLEALFMLVNTVVYEYGPRCLTLCLPWGPMDPKMKFDLTLLRTDSIHDFHVT